MTQYLDSQHHWVILDTQELADALDEAVEARDLPGMADVDASLLLLCRKMKETATVALSGNAPMRFSAATPGTGTRRCGSGQASLGPIHRLAEFLPDRRLPGCIGPGGLRIPPV